MRGSILAVVTIAMLAVPFGLLWARYDHLPSPFPLLHAWKRGPILCAAKSPIVVFRVPVMGVLTAAAAGLMWRHFAAAGEAEGKASVLRLWSALLITASLKSFFQGLDLATSGTRGPGLLAVATLVTVFVGLVVAAAQLPGASTCLKQRDRWRLSGTEQAAFGLLLLAYLLVAFVPILRAMP